MADWTGGYPSQDKYLDTIQTLTTPKGIDIGLLAQGRALPHRGRPYRYCELGCGTAFSMTALAAANPESTFVGYDFMPEHIVRAMGLIEDGGLNNIVIHEASFEDLAAGPAPEPFDYIVLHGVWSWVSAENQRYLVEILNRWLKPGGIAYLGYSAAAGWMALAPMRRLFRELPAGEGDDRYGPARAAMEAMIAVQPETDIARKWKLFKDLPDDYLVHDLGADEATADWQGDIAAALAPAKLEFLSPANLIEQMGPLYYTEEQLEFIGKAMAEGWGETARDLATGANFRTDLYGRGAPMIPAVETWQTFSTMTIAPWKPLLAREVQMNARANSQPWDDGMAEAIERVLADGEMTIGTFADKLGGDQKSGLQVALALIAIGLANVVRPQAELAAVNESLGAFHDALRRRYANKARMPGVASARLMGPMQLSEAEHDALFGDETPDPKIAEGLSRLALPGF